MKPATCQDGPCDGQLVVVSRDLSSAYYAAAAVTSKRLSVLDDWSGRQVGLVEAGLETPIGLGELIAQLCKTRPVHAGSVIGSGPHQQLRTAAGATAVSPSSEPPGRR